MDSHTALILHGQRARELQELANNYRMRRALRPVDGCCPQPPRRSRIGCLLIALIASLAAVGCAAAAGSGTISTETRSVPPFDELVATDGLIVEATIDPAALPEVTVAADDNLIDQIETRVSNGRLLVGTNGDIRPTAGTIVRIVAGQLDVVEASAGAVLRLDGVDSDRLRVAASTRSILTVVGRADVLQVEASTGSASHLDELETLEAEITASTAAEVEVLASASTVAEGSSAAVIRLVGEPDRVWAHTTSGARIERNG